MPSSVKGAGSVFAIALNFSFVFAVGVGAIVAAILFSAHETLTRPVGTFASILRIHDLPSCNGIERAL
jgi:hypothetical protein